MTINLGSLTFHSALDHPGLLATPLKEMLEKWQGATPASNFLVAEIDPGQSDTDDFCAAYGISVAVTANCLIVEGRRASIKIPAACLVPAHARADINGIVRRHLEARQASFANRDFAVQASGQEYGSITIFGLPSTWPLLIDEALTKLDYVLIGGSLRKSKLLVPGSALRELPGVVILESLTKQ